MICVFMSRPLASSGYYRYKFTVPGVYYYSSGYIDNTNLRLLQGVVKVQPREERSSQVSVKVEGIEAKLMAGGKKKRCFREMHRCSEDADGWSFHLCRFSACDQSSRAMCGLSRLWKHQRHIKCALLQLLQLLHPHRLLNIS